MPKSRYHGLILAGGRGTRFWPRSRTLTPKQLLPFVGEKSLLQETLARLGPVIPPERIWILTNEQLRKQILHQLPNVPPGQVLAEPAQRNTAPCLALAAQLIHQQDRDAVLGVFPADHHIAKPAEYRKLLKPAFAAAETGLLATIGIEPRWPETGYGYLEFPPGVIAGSLQAQPVRRFCEKPDLKTARKFLRAGRFYWNAGMFFWRAETFLDQMRKHQPRTSALLASLPPLGGKKFREQLKLTYPLCESISVDYAVMEKAAADNQVVGVPAGDIGWSDLGSWNAVYELLPRDADSNAVRSEVILAGAKRCYVEAQGKLVALVGVEDLVIVDTPDALLVVHRDHAQRVGELVKMIEKSKHTHLL
ncbi:MAG: mannose-1-phosphate guanylyltransferase [Acidobacteriia bacterium]|nr:mannose-1-phosphate guanylyltransferase [Terriglobia bacterium]